MFLSCQPKSGGVYFCTLVRVKLNFDGNVVCKLFGCDAELVRCERIIRNSVDGLSQSF